MSDLSGIQISGIYRASFLAVARLQLFLTARVHEQLSEFMNEARSILLYHSGKDGALDAVHAFRAQQDMLGEWGDVISTYTVNLQKARKIAAALPFGAMAEMHGRLIEGVDPEITEAVDPIGGIFNPLIQSLLSVAAEYNYGDNLNLSGRIWRMDRDAREGMGQMISMGISQGKSAWTLAQELEIFLGADQDCPRWTEDRLYRTSKKDIAGGDLTGLISAPNCDGQGVAYNALRLSRTEIQKAHALATDRTMASSPWVQQEKVNLSVQHPEHDICDDVVEGGENGEGIYDVGTIELPLHPNCLCYKTAIQIPEDQFVGDLRSWMKGETEWPEMDQYGQTIGWGPDRADPPSLANDRTLIQLGVWLLGEALDL